MSIAEGTELEQQVGQSITNGEHIVEIAPEKKEHLLSDETRDQYEQPEEKDKKDKNPYTQSIKVIQSGVTPLNNAIYTGFNYRKADTNDYEEDMEPWLKDENRDKNYLFACSTTYIEELKSNKGCACCKGKEKKQNASKEQTSVYHKLDSKRLIIKKKEHESQMTKIKKNPCCIAAVIIIFISISLIIAGAAQPPEEEYVKTGWRDWEWQESDDGTTAAAFYGVGALFFVIGIILCFVNKRGGIQNDEFVMITQSIPINSIFYIDRKVEQESQMKDSGCINIQCNNCCCEPEEHGMNYSTISIGYNRSYLSEQFSSSANTKDFITLTLVSNQAYNLHQYLNCIIDGTHPYFNNINIKYNYIDDNQLPK